mgnify:CR=1 FL=1
MGVILGVFRDVRLAVLSIRAQGPVYRVSLRVCPTKDGILICLPCQLVQLFQFLPQSAQGGDHRLIIGGQRRLKEKGIRFYMTEHIADLNEQLRKLGLGYMIEEGSVRRTIHIALKDMGIKRPYPLEGGVDNDDRSASRKRADNRVQEFVWAFGTETEEQIEKQILLQIEQLKEGGDVENLLHGRWSHMEAMDEDEWLEHLEEHLKEIVNISGKDEKTLARRLEEHRREVHDRIATEHPELAERFKERRHVLDEHLKQRRPEVYELVVSLREKEETDLK